MSVSDHEIARVLSEALPYMQRYDEETIVWPGHGAATTLGTERPHLEDWVARGW